MFTNKLACLIKLFSSKSAGAVRLKKAWGKKRKICIVRGEGKNCSDFSLFVFFFLFRFCSLLFVVVVVCLLSLSFRKLSLVSCARWEGKQLLCRLPTKHSRYFAALQYFYLVWFASIHLKVYYRLLLRLVIAEKLMRNLWK